ncbi:integrase and RNaseH domain-containing protein, partial [Golovinomyces cichoracearum]
MTRPYWKKDKDLQPLKRGRGRPKGSRNKVHLIDNYDPDNFEGQFVQGNKSENNNNFDTQILNDNDITSLHSMTFVSHKEQADRQLSLKLRREGKITAPGAPYEESDIIELEGLRNQEVMEFVTYDPNKHMG